MVCGYIHSAHQESLIYNAVEEHCNRINYVLGRSRVPAKILGAVGMFRQQPAKMVCGDFTLIRLPELGVLQILDVITDC